MKKLLALLLAVLMVVALFAGCAPKAEDPATPDKPAKEDPKDEPAKEDEPADKEYVIAYVGIGSVEPAWMEMEAGIKDAADAAGIKLLVTGATEQFDQVQQNAAIEDMIARGVDAIIIGPCDGAGVCNAIEECYNAGIPVVTMNIASESELVVSHVANDDVADSAKAAEYIAEQIGYKGKVVNFVGGLAIKPGVDRRQGFNDTMAKYPDIEVIEVMTEWDTEKAMKGMEDALNANEIAGIFCAWDGGTLAAFSAIQAKGLEDKIVVVGTDAYPDAIALIRDGVWKGGDIAKDMFYMGQCSFETALKAAKGEEVESFVDTGSLLVTAENVEQYIAEYNVTFDN